MTARSPRSEPSRSTSGVVPEMRTASPSPRASRCTSESRSGSLKSAGGPVVVAQQRCHATIVSGVTMDASISSKSRPSAFPFAANRRRWSRTALKASLSGEPHLRVRPAAGHPTPLPSSPGLSEHAFAAVLCLPQPCNRFDDLDPVRGSGSRSPGGNRPLPMRFTHTDS